MSLTFPLASIDESQNLLAQYAPALLGELESRYPEQLARAGPMAAEGSLAVRRLGRGPSTEAHVTDITVQYWSSRSALRVAIELCSVAIPAGETRLRSAFRVGLLGKAVVVLGATAAVGAAAVHGGAPAEAWRTALEWAAAVLTVVGAAMIVIGDGTVGLPELRETLSAHISELKRARTDAEVRHVQLTKLDPVNERHFDLINTLTADVNAICGVVDQAVKYVFRVARNAPQAEFTPALAEV
jgi:hypothetical protein